MGQQFFLNIGSCLISLEFIIAIYFVDFENFKFISFILHYVSLNLATEFSKVCIVYYIYTIQYLEVE